MVAGSSTAFGRGAPLQRGLAAARRAKQGAAREARERLGSKLGKELAEVQGQLESIVEVLLDETVCEEVQRRVRAAVPALASLCAGRTPTGQQRVQRNVAWHADEMPPAAAEASAWRRAQRGPRLERRCRPEEEALEDGSCG